MIGQKNLIQDINHLVDTDKFPRFTILTGIQGSGKKTICKYIGRKLDASVFFSENKVDDVREVISNAYKCTGRPCVYVFADADNMSPAAKNALLKVTEEPPKNAYIIITLVNLNNTYATIRSRGTVMPMNQYSLAELQEYLSTVHPTVNEGKDILESVCTVPGELDLMIQMGHIDFYNYVGKVVDNIARVSGCNSFKIANAIKFKDTDEDKYDLRLFWKAFISICMDRLLEDKQRYTYGIQVTSKYMQDLNITGINKQSTFDLWVLAVRKGWM